MPEDRNILMHKVIAHDVIGLRRSVDCERLATSGQISLSVAMASTGRATVGVLVVVGRAAAVDGFVEFDAMSEYATSAVARWGSGRRI
nr:hypothetical protein [Rhodococcus qingshengii]THJ65684.1 hypothetical protein EU244_28730 [Rhodococcus qingshengii]